MPLTYVKKSTHNISSPTSSPISWSHSVEASDEGRTSLLVVLISNRSVGGFAAYSPFTVSRDSVEATSSAFNIAQVSTSSGPIPLCTMCVHILHDPSPGEYDIVVSYSGSVEWMYALALEYRGISPISFGGNNYGFDAVTELNADTNWRYLGELDNWQYRVNSTKKDFGVIDLSVLINTTAFSIDGLDLNERHSQEIAQVDVPLVFKATDTTLYDVPLKLSWGSNIHGIYYEEVELTPAAEPVFSAVHSQGFLEILYGPVGTSYGVNLFQETLSISDEGSGLEFSGENLLPVAISPLPITDGSHSVTEHINHVNAAISDSGVGTESNLARRFEVLDPETTASVETVTLGTGTTDGVVIGYVQTNLITTDPVTGRIYLVRRIGTTSTLFYSDDEGATWTNDGGIVAAYPTGLHIDSEGTLHFIAFPSTGITYYNRPAGGSWSVVETIELEGDDGYHYHAQSWLGSDDTLHVGIMKAVGDYPYIFELHYYTRDPDTGAWSTVETIEVPASLEQQIDCEDFRLAVNSAGDVLAVCRIEGNTIEFYRDCYFYRPASTGTWVFGYLNQYQDYSDGMGLNVDDSGTFHLLYELYDNPEEFDGYWGMRYTTFDGSSWTTIHDYEGSLGVYAPCIKIVGPNQLVAFGMRGRGSSNYPVAAYFDGSEWSAAVALGPATARNYDGIFTEQSGLNFMYRNDSTINTNDSVHFVSWTLLYNQFVRAVNGVDEVTVTALPDFSETAQGVDFITLTKGNSAEVLNHPHATKLYLAVETPRTVWTGRVLDNRGDHGTDSTSPIDTDFDLYHYDGANAEGFDLDNFLPDLTAYIGTTPGGREHGKCRVKEVKDTDCLRVIADMACVWDKDDYITITDQHAFWPRPHRVRVSGDNIYTYKDMGSYLRELLPVPIMGPPVCAFLGADSEPVTVPYDGTQSYLVQPNSQPYTDPVSPEEGALGWDAQGIVSWSWWFEGADVPVASGATTTATYSTPGRYVAKLTVTDRNGKTCSTFRNVWIFTRTGANTPVEDFTLTSLRGTLDSHGWEATLEITRSLLDPEVLPNGAQVVLFAEEYYNGESRTHGMGHAAFHNRHNIKLVGWAHDNAISISKNGTRKATVAVQGLQEHIREISNFPVYMTQIDTTMNSSCWSYFNVLAEPKDGLTVRKALYFLIKDHWTLINFTDVLLPDDHNNYLAGQTFPEGSLAQQLDEFCPCIQARWAVDSSGSLVIFSWPNWLPTTGLGKAWRDRIPISYELADADISDVSITPRFQRQACTVQVEGLMAFDTGANAWSIDSAPGDIRGFSGSPVIVSNQVLGSGGFAGSQGYELAQMIYSENMRREENVVFRLSGNYSACDMVPNANKVSVTLALPGYLRGFAWDHKRFWVLGVEYGFKKGGVVSTTLTCLPETYPTGRIYSQADAIQYDATAVARTREAYLANIISTVAEPADTRIPALIGAGPSGKVDGPLPGTSYARLYGQADSVVLVENREFKPIANRYVLLEVIKDSKRSGTLMGAAYRVVEVMRDRWDPANDDTALASQVHRGELPCPGLLEVKTQAAATPLPVEGYKVVLYQITAHVRVPGSGMGSITVDLTQNGSVIGSVSISNGQRRGATTLASPIELNTGDYLDFNITAVPASYPGEDLIVTAVTREFGI